MAQDSVTWRIKEVQRHLEALRQHVGASSEAQTLLAAPIEELFGSLEELGAIRQDLEQREQDLVQAQQALEEERRRSQELFDLTPDGCILTDVEGVVLEANRAAMALLGIGRDFVVGVPFIIFVSNQDRRAFGSLLAQVRIHEEIESQEWELRLQPRRGTAFAATLSVSAVRTAGGRLAGLRWLLRDATANKQSREREQQLVRAIEDRQVMESLARRLEEERQILETIMENTHAQLAYLDPQFNFVRVNAAYALASGCTEEELLGCNYFALFPNAENEAIFEQVRDTGRPAFFRAKPFQYLDRPGRGTSYWDWSLVPIHDGRGQVQGLVFSLLDVTEQVLARQQIEAMAAEAQRQADELAAMFAAMADAVQVYDATGLPVRANAAAEALYGVDPVGIDRMVLAGRIALRHLDGRPVPPEELPSSRALRGEPVVREAYRATNSAGERLDLVSSATPILTNGRISRAVLVWHDVTEREQLLERNRSQREFLERLLESAPVGIAVVRGEDYRYEFVNAYYQAIPGVPDVPPVGHTIKEVLPDRIGKKWLEAVQQAYRTGQVASLREFQVPAGSGGEKTYWNVDHVPLKGSEGQVEGVLVIAAEITEQVRARREIERMAARDAAILTSMTEGVVVFDLEGNIVSMNPAALRLHGFRRVEEAQMHMSRYPDLFEMCYLDSRLVPPEEWPASRMARGESFTGVDLKVRRIDTGQTWIGSYSGTSVLDKEGQLVLGILTLHDVTAEKAAAAERERLLGQLEIERARLKAIIDNAPEAIIVADAESRIILANPAAERLYARPLPFGREFERHADLMLCYPDGMLYDPRDLPLTRSALDGQVSSKVEMAILSPAGQLRDLLVSSAPIRDRKGRITGAVGTFQDITELKRMEAALRESREKLRALFDLLPVGVSIFDKDGNIVAFNTAVERIWGISRQALLAGSSRTRQLLRSDGTEMSVDELPGRRAFVEGRAVENVEIGVAREDGSTCWGLVNAMPLPFGDWRVAVTTLDITERHQVRLALNRSAERLRILHESDQAILAARSVDEIATAALHHIRRLAGCEQASVALFDREIGEVQLLAAEVEGEIRKSKEWRVPLGEEWPTEELSQGQICVVEEVAALQPPAPLFQILQSEGVRSYIHVPLISRGELIGALNLGMSSPGSPPPELVDIAREMAAELAIGISQARLHERVQQYAGDLEQRVARRTATLQASQARLRTIFEGAAIGIILADLEGRIFESNPAMQSLLGYSDGELQSMAFVDFSHPEDVAADVARFEELVTGKRDSYQLEKRYLCKDGQIRWGRLTVSLARRPGGGPLFAIHMVEDITEQKQMQDALIQAEKLSVAGRLAASLAHEISNPLQTVIGCLGLAQEALGEGGDINRYLEVAHGELRRAARTVTQLRDLHRLSRTEEKQLVNVNELLEQVLLLCRKKCEECRIDVSWQPDARLEPLLLMSDRVRQVFLNLALNAVDALSAGGRLQISTAQGSEPAGVRVEFTDTGCGIAPDTLSQIFEPFFSTKPMGMGLGLYISRRIVEEHGGQIQVTSQLGQGTTLTIWLPSAGSAGQV
jgi:PAS domain S-box-containing protein